MGGCQGAIKGANENFLNLMGYPLPELGGKHHSMFVNRNSVASNDCEAFWQALGEGRHQDCEFKRVTKAGKFATDVTARVRTVSSPDDALKRLCSGDFGFHLTEPFSAEFEFLRHDLNRSVSQLCDTFREISGSVEIITQGTGRSRKGSATCLGAPRARRPISRRRLLHSRRLPPMSALPPSAPRRPATW